MHANGNITKMGELAMNLKSSVYANPELLILSTAMTSDAALRARFSETPCSSTRP